MDGKVPFSLYKVNLLAHACQPCLPSNRYLMWHSYSFGYVGTVLELKSRKILWILLGLGGLEVLLALSATDIAPFLNHFIFWDHFIQRLRCNDDTFFCGVSWHETEILQLIKVFFVFVVTCDLAFYLTKTFMGKWRLLRKNREPLLVSKIWVVKVPKVHKSDKCRIILIVGKSFEYLFIEYDGKVSNPTIELEKFRKIFCLKPYVLVEAVRTCFKLIYCEISICHHII